MSKYIFVIALALPVCVFAEKNDFESWNLDSQCFNQTNEKVSSAYNHYSKMLTSFIQKKDSESLANLKASFTNFITVINETCAKGKVPSNVNNFFFIDLIEFAVKDDKFTNFTNSNGNACVDAIKPDIRKCIHDQLGTTTKPKAGNDTNVNATGVHGEHGPGGNIVNGGHGTTDGNDTNIAQIQIKQNLLSLLRKTNLVFSEYTCDKTTDIRTCIVSAMMKKHNATCTTEHSKFVDSLFDFAFSMKKCPPSQVAAKRSGAASFLFNPVVILLSLFGTMLIK